MKSVPDVRVNKSVSTVEYGYAFALAYQILWEERFAVPMSRLFSGMVEHFQIHGNTFADIACGTGRFAYEIAKQGYKGTGIDLSPHMIRIARQRASQTVLELVFEVHDMRCFRLSGPVDFITCWFDSINYLHSIDEVTQVFERCYGFLKLGGALLFDMETDAAFRDRWQRHKPFHACLRQGLKALLQRQPYSAFHLLQDTWLSRRGQSVRTFEAKEARVRATSRSAYMDGVLETTLTCHVLSSGEKLPISEAHIQRTFDMESIKECLYNIGFSSIRVFRLPDFSLPTAEEKGFPKNTQVFGIIGCLGFFC